MGLIGAFAEGLNNLLNTLGMPMIWVIVAVIFGIIEAVTLGLATIWFCGGALVAALLAMLGFSPGAQFGAFIVVSVVLLYFTRPIAKKQLNAKIFHTNSDALIGKTAVVISDIEPRETGQVRVDGKEWTAVSEDGNIRIAKGSEVIVKKIEGVKLVVEAQR